MLMPALQPHISKRQLQIPPDSFKSKGVPFLQSRFATQAPGEGGSLQEVEGAVALPWFLSTLPLPLKC